MSDTWGSDTVNHPTLMAMSRFWLPPSPRTSRARRCQPFLEHDWLDHVSWGDVFKRWSVTPPWLWKIPASNYSKLKTVQEHETTQNVGLFLCFPNRHVTPKFERVAFKDNLATRWFGETCDHRQVEAWADLPYPCCSQCCHTLETSLRQKGQQTIRKIVEVWPICGIGVCQMVGWCWMLVCIQNFGNRPAEIRRCDCQREVGDGSRSWDAYSATVNFII